MASVASHLIEEVTAHAQSESLEDAREICADGTHFPNSLSIYKVDKGDYNYEYTVAGLRTSKEFTQCRIQCP